MEMALESECTHEDGVTPSPQEVLENEDEVGEAAVDGLGSKPRQVSWY